MLAIVRREGESVDIYDGDTRIGTVCFVHKVCGSQAKLGFEFPSRYTILRSEVPLDPSRRRVGPTRAEREARDIRVE